MKAVVTGGAGFIGSHLVKALIEEGVTVHVIDNLSTGKREQIHPEAVLHVLDVRCTELKKLMVAEKPDIVFHLAAQVDVQTSIRDPGYDALVNIVGTVNLLEACHESSSVKKIVYSSSSAVYGDQTDLLSEANLTQPISYYGVSKLTPEYYLRIYHQLYGLTYTILRYANVFGPNQTAKGEGGVVAIFLDHLKSGRPLVIHGDGEQIRDFIFVKDIARANLAAMKQGDNEIINVSTATPTSVNQLVHFLTEIHGPQVVVKHEQARLGDIIYSCLDNKKAADLLEWTPHYNINKGLRETYDYVMQDDK